jgi:glucokinase
VSRRVLRVRNCQRGSSGFLFVSRYVVDLALGLKACIMLIDPVPHRHRRQHRQGRLAPFDPLRAELRRQITDWSGVRIEVVSPLYPTTSVLYGALAMAAAL